MVERSSGPWQAYHIPPNATGWDRVLDYAANTRIAAIGDNALDVARAFASGGAVYLVMPGAAQQTISPADPNFTSTHVRTIESDADGVVSIWYERWVSASGSLSPAYNSLYHAVRHLDGSITNSLVFEGSRYNDHDGVRIGKIAYCMDASRRNGHSRAAIRRVDAGYVRWVQEYFTDYPGFTWNQVFTSPGTGVQRITSRVDSDSQGSAHHCWSYGVQAAFLPIYYTSASNGWGNVSLGIQRPYSSGDIAVTSGGGVLVAWFDEDWSIRLARRSGTSWTITKSSDYMTERILGGYLRMVAQ